MVYLDWPGSRMGCWLIDERRRIWRRWRHLCRREFNSGDVPTFEHLILFDEATLTLGLKKGAFTPQSDLDLAWGIKYARGEESADLMGLDVFKFLVELALDKAQFQRVKPF